MVLAESDGELTPPPSGPAEEVDAMDVDEEENGGGVEHSPVVTVGSSCFHLHVGSAYVQGRRTKRKVVYVESESEADSEVAAPTSTAAKGRKPRKSLKAHSDSDDFVMDDDDDEAFAAAMDDYESSVAQSPSVSAHSISPPPKAKAKKKPSTFSAPKPVSRPPPQPLASGSRPNNSNAGRSGSNSNSFLTQAETKKQLAAEQKRLNEDCFDFIKEENIMDKHKNRPDHPDYDGRTIYIPPSAFAKMSPFEKQFWEIKQNHFDTVLFFQKGKFFELYEEDARIGHRDFDLKLTDRVKMAMVGVPEQSFEFWAAKFLGAGYKVGKVEQAETAIG
jgi:DNA mismatch repair protein MSH6